MILTYSSLLRPWVDPGGRYSHTFCSSMAHVHWGLWDHQPVSTAPAGTPCVQWTFWAHNVSFYIAQKPRGWTLPLFALFPLFPLNSVSGEKGGGWVGGDEWQQWSLWTWGALRSCADVCRCHSSDGGAFLPRFTPVAILYCFITAELCLGY